MEYLSVVAAAAAAWIFGAIWYGIVGKAWMADVGLSPDSMKKINVPAFIGSFICAILVAGMTRHIFISSGVTTLNSAAISGLGLGLFIATPWVATNYLFAQRPMRLIFIDGVYATVGCTVIGAVLVLI